MILGHILATWSLGTTICLWTGYKLNCKWTTVSYIFADIKYLAVHGTGNNTPSKRILPAACIITHKLIFFTYKFHHASWIPWRKYLWHVTCPSTMGRGVTLLSALQQLYACVWKIWGIQKQEIGCHQCIIATRPTSSVERPDPHSNFYFISRHFVVHQNSSVTKAKLYTPIYKHRILVSFTYSTHLRTAH